MPAMRDISQSNQFKCTIVSFLPFTIIEPKPGQTPGEFKIVKSDGEIPSCLVVQEGTYGIYLDGDRGTLRARTPSSEVARSVIEDYVIAQLATNPEALPALFVVPGAHTPEEVLKHFPEEIEDAKASQNRWFTELVKMGDDIWNRYHQHAAITDLMRHACKALGLAKDKDWMNVTSRSEGVINCPACYAPIMNAKQALCGACHCVLNIEAYEKLTFAQKTPAGSLANALSKLQGASA